MREDDRAAIGAGDRGGSGLVRTVRLPARVLSGRLKVPLLARWAMAGRAAAAAGSRMHPAVFISGNWDPCVSCAC